MTDFQKDPNVRVAAHATCMSRTLSGLSVAAKTPGSRPKQYRNHRDLLADEDVDTVLIATPQGWHSQ